MKEALPFLLHILNEIEYIQKKTENISYNDLIVDPDLSRSIPRSLEIIGEAVRNLPSEFLDSHPDISWSKIVGMRDKLIHGYFGIKWIVVWSVITQDIPELEPKIRKILEDVSEGL